MDKQLRDVDLAEWQKLEAEVKALRQSVEDLLERLKAQKCKAIIITDKR